MRPMLVIEVGDCTRASDALLEGPLSLYFTSNNACPSAS
jgi:hypothetical protein